MNDVGKDSKKKSDQGHSPDTTLKLKIDGKKRSFNIDDPKLPDWIEEGALASGDFPYDEKMPNEEYAEILERLQIELVKMQYWLQDTGGRVISVFEGRDAAGKGGTIFNLRQYMNPRTARNVALPKPSETERGQWYFQRYISHFPTTGEFVTFDRSWYNRGGVEPVLGFCTPEQHESFLAQAPGFEHMIVADGIYFFKFWLNIGQIMQLKRFHDRRHSPLKSWKFSPIDIQGAKKWDDYTKARDTMLERTHTPHAPWTVVRSNDKRRARIAVIRRILLSLPYNGRDPGVIGNEDSLIIGSGPGFI
ncbi:MULTISPECIES: polyphosphate kinase 2 [Phyllobacterium]|jgi:polyphosphate kinase 2|uniref:ADP/GDP-polyphosphate phosphotransferase n=1 Tax=Phyllobacterium sophorae TaxID=1520277 RepID=A0A2P7BCF9_9HYPH|nr:polyphosphate kinase 2 [Phyllobacterium sophorae]PSH64112.1 polyphosphate kinase 2 [Phyllobacterium sophorae]